MPFVLNTRRNHALEHATLHVLATKYPNKPMAGHSNPTGFFILGSVPTEDVRWAVNEAESRLRAGESNLAIHPGCGTNLATSTVVAATFAWFAMRGARSMFSQLMRLPLALAFAFAGAVVSRPLGPMLQEKVTTDADLDGLRVLSIEPAMSGRVQAHRVRTTDR
jgi:hypothetical protein